MLESPPCKNNSTPLKQAILARVSTTKKQPIKKYSNIQTIRFQQSNHWKQQLILKYQSTKNEGFFQYSNWITFNKQYFPYVNKIYIDQLWKILRIVNYGEVYIPTGLIFQIYQVLIQKNYIPGKIESVINEFLKLNKVNDSLYNFRQLNKYKKISEVQLNYKGLNNESNSKQKNICHPFQVFQRVYKDAKKRSQNKNTLLCYSIDKQVNQYKFHPSIKPYQSQQKHDSICKPERICHHKQQWVSKPQQIYQIQQFKASQFNSAIFEGSIDTIPGVQSHVNRHKHIQAQKQRIKRYIEKPSAKKNYC